MKGETLTMPNEVKITGWDFSPLTLCGRMRETPLPWDFSEIVKQNFSRAGSMLDMGTGGGEFLCSLAPLPVNTCATEGYEPNVKIAELNLRPLGVKVISNYSDDMLPLKNDYFDLIINRHEYYEPKEVYRILKPGGKFITQQVSGNCDDTIVKLFKPGTAGEFAGWNLSEAVCGLQSIGFIIHEKNEAAGFTIFADIEALISYMNVINWLIPDFSKEKYRKELEQANRQIQKEGSFNSTLDRFLIIASK